MGIGDRVFVSFLNDDNQKIEGFFILVEQRDNYIKIRTGDNILTLPYCRILKIKEAVQDG